MAENKESQESEQIQIHDQCKKVIEFHNHLIRFMSIMKGTFPELLKRISKCYKYYKSLPRSKYIKKLLENMSPHIKHISEYDEGIFSDDYQKGKLQFIIGLDFKQVFAIIESEEFGDDDLRDTTKKHIFNHLQSIYVSAQMADMQVSSFNEAMTKQKKFLINMLKNVNIDEQLKEKIEKLAADEDEGSGGGMMGMESLKKLSEVFGGDNFISKLAKDVTDELDLGVGCDNPVEAITDLFANNGRKLEELLVKVGDKIKEKIDNGDITEDQLVEEANKMKQKMTDVVGPIPETETDPIKFFEAEYSKLDEDDQKKFINIKTIIENNPEHDDWTDTEKEEFQSFSEHCMRKNALNMMSGLLPGNN
jgi:hypothetical protein